MKDIQQKILDNYGIDIAQEDIFKLYKIDKPDLSEQELQSLIESTRMRWNQSINGANEKNAERDRLRLEKAEKYERILWDESLRKELFSYYQGGGSSGKGGAESPEAAKAVEFAKEYFELIGTTKKIKKQDVDFFFSYYKKQKKYKKDILNMLEKELKVHGVNKGNDKENEYSDDEPLDEGKKKNKSSVIIVNLFQENTIIKLRNCIDLYETALQNSEVCQRYPELQQGLFEFINLNSIDNICDFAEMVKERAKEVYNVRQERGTEYVPLVDLFNSLKTLSDYKDVIDNFPEFKLLIKYPALTPYMFAFVDMKPATMKGLVDVANRDYYFRDDADFILNYYNIVHDNFGITDKSIKSIIKKANKKAAQNKVMNKIDEKLFKTKGRKMALGATILHWLVYLPIFIIYFLFEVCKLFFTEILHLAAIPIFVVLFVASNIIFPEMLGIENLLILGKMVNKTKWIAYLENDIFGAKLGNIFWVILESILLIALLIMVYVLPPLIIASFVSGFSEDFNKRFDWIGIDRTFKNIIQTLRTKTENQFFHERKSFYKKNIAKVLINLFCIAIVLAIIYFVPILISNII